MTAKFFQDPEGWPRAERREDQETMYDIAHQLAAEFRVEISKLNDRIGALTDSVTSYTEKQADALHGFPNDDPDGHRRHHEAEIQAALDRGEFYRKLRFELAKWGLIGFAGWVVFQLWQGLLHGPGK